LKSQIGTSSSHGGRRKLPYAFTENGAVMSANVLNSPEAQRRRYIKAQKLCALLAELNHQLIRDEGHRNRMTVPELKRRMRG
jgi:hypothetical protein